MSGGLLQRWILRLARDRNGGAALEFALIASALFTFLLGIAWLGYVLWVQNALDYSAAEAARCAANSSTCGAPASQTSSLVTAYAAGIAGAGIPSSAFTYTAPANGTCGYKVQGSYQVPLVVPFVNISLTLSSEACYPQ